jgi:hypothetical protein
MRGLRCQGGLPSVKQVADRLAWQPGRQMGWQGWAGQEAGQEAEQAPDQARLELQVKRGVSGEGGGVVDLQRGRAGQMCRAGRGGKGTAEVADRNQNLGPLHVVSLGSRRHPLCNNPSCSCATASSRGLLAVSSPPAARA